MPCQMGHRYHRGFHPLKSQIQCLPFLANTALITSGHCYGACYSCSAGSSHRLNKRALSRDASAEVQTRVPPSCRGL